MLFEGKDLERLRDWFHEENQTYTVKELKLPDLSNGSIVMINKVPYQVIQAKDGTYQVERVSDK